MLNKHELLNQNDKKSLMKKGGKSNGQKNEISNRNIGYRRQFAQQGAVVGHDGRLLRHITCYNCQRKGHYSDHCPYANNNNEDEKNLEARGEVKFT